MLNYVEVTRGNLTAVAADVRGFLFNNKELIDGFSEVSASGPFEPTGVTKTEEISGHNIHGGTIKHRRITTGEITTHICVGDRVWLSKDFVIIDHKDYNSNPYYLAPFTIVHTGTDTAILNKTFDINVAFEETIPIGKFMEIINDPTRRLRYRICDRYTVSFTVERKHFLIRLRETGNPIFGHGQHIDAIKEICENGGIIRCGGISKCNNRAHSYRMNVTVDSDSRTATIRIFVGAKDAGFDEN